MMMPCTKILRVKLTCMHLHVVVLSCLLSTTAAGKLLFKSRQQLDDSLCPDGLTTCPDDSTCCTTINGQYTCCPILQVEELPIPGLVKMSADSGVVICPGKTAECPDRNTCCPLKDGHWGCCPLPNAVCCSDQTHCCPSGSTCDTAHGSCSSLTEKLAWVTKTLAKSIKPISQSYSQSATSTVQNIDCVVCPDGKSQCPDGTTCCRMPGGIFGCCPMPDAVCCEDHLHCCPQFTTCNIKKGRCDNIGGEVFPWQPTYPIAAVKCDDKVECPTGQTCCQTAKKEWACCPLPQAVCCSDSVHCCPHDTTCDVSQGRCIKKDGNSYPWLEKTAALVRKVENVHCSPEFSCSTGDTCCKLASGNWGCCPLPKAVCCSDGVHCCPHDTTCDVSQGRCIKKDGNSYPWLEKTAAIVRKVENVQCSPEFSCPTGDTCCKLQSGQWGCCPLPKAVCCSDGVHCCPHDTTCDVSQGRCIKKDGNSYPWLEKTAAIARKDENIQCSTSISCPTGDTCCKLQSGQWGCCPLPKAVCCSDGVHCCPHDTTCDVSRGKCNKKDGNSYPWLEKTAAIVKKVENVECSPEFSCPTGDTCCKLQSGQWGCCPLPKAVCCSDGVHCCPHETTCDVSQGRCIKKDGNSYPWLEKTAAIVKKVENVECSPEFSCPTGDTCCKLQSGQWGCCPLPKAVCCSDGVHCCPHETTCDVSQGRCIKKDGNSYPWLEKTAAIVKKVENVECSPEFSCPTGDTCCKLQSGQWGCCPLPKAVCCSDGVHCCPHDTTCDVSQGRCIKKDGNSYPWLEKTAAIVKKVENVQCSPEFSCRTGDTCCKLQSGQWGCCPLPKAVCCSDGVHCCPHETTCDVSQGRCIKKDGNSYPWLEKTAAIVKKVENVECSPEFSCRTGDTCCKLQSGQWGCCPLPKAVCCSDGLHCCPHDTTCQGRCIKKDGNSYPWLEKTAAIARKDENIQCSPSISCPTGDTCCKLQSGQWGCCPLPKAVCCSDGVHCCPHDTTCDVSQGKCNKKDGNSYPWLEKTAAIVKKVENVQCSPEFSCPTGDTCCKLQSGQWGCCPLPKAVCCSDGLHCCPHDTTCQVRCIKKDGNSYPWLEKTAAIARKDENIQCSPSISCPTGDTCCKLQSGQWGCCPLPKAVCCSDGVHCCPHDTTCDVSQGKCNKKDGNSYPWLEKTAAIVKKVENVQCSPEFSCPTGDTCCKLQSGQWGCCPLPKAVCCSDGVHCCPHDTTCDVSQGRCIKKDGNSYPWLEKTAAIVRNDEDVQCSPQFSCRTGDTCCKLQSGQWGCCPLPKAVCCSDGVHCCPHDTTCDVSQGRCMKKDGNSYPWLEKTAAIVRNDEDVQCSPQFSCRTGDTCCKLQSGQWGCCPLPKAVCCSDGVHCCPHDTTCDVSQGKCNKKDGNSYPWLEKTAAIVRKVENVQCSPQFSCPTGDTCCKLQSGQWGCCPLPKAVCCSDGVHCCPHDTTCDVSQGRCIKKDGNSYPWLEKTAAIVRNDEDVQCSPQFSCRTGDTCCKLQSGQWGCCPLPKAVCCSDGVHCCPHDTTCDVSQGRCMKKDGNSYPWLEKTAAIVRNDEDVQCSPQFSCRTGDTCCKLQSGQWGCCPLPKAVCCSDGVHCCPHDTTCDVSQVKCNNKDGNSYPWLEKTAAIVKKVENVQCSPEFSCPTGDTCCKLQSGQWGCCPLPKAVCCSDGVHCCPHETTCDVSQGRCIKKDGNSYPWLEKTAAIVENVQCSPEFSCPTGDTCCKLQSGQWGCCPLPKAVCCSDGVHCCPHDTTCDVSQGRCIKKDGNSYPWLEKTAAIVRKVENVQCSPEFSCPTGETCCKLQSGQWGCCPLPKAVCCSDGLHCCPHDTTCDVSQGRCIKKDGKSYPWLEKTAAIVTSVQTVNSVSIHTFNNVICQDGKSECPDGSTCCVEQSGQYGCCPLEKAVCCEDHLHCCPQGTKCDVSEGKCLKGSARLPMYKKIPAGKVEPDDNTQSIVCKDSRHCPDHYTCCPLGSEKYGCCPLANATCCEDMVHCCPYNYSCDSTTGRCIKGANSIPFVLKQFP